MCPVFLALDLDFWLCSNPANGMRAPKVFVFVDLFSGILVRHVSDASFISTCGTTSYLTDDICCYLFRFVCWGLVHLWVFNCGELS